jgi:S1-C subfamily serine protease
MGPGGDEGREADDDNPSEHPDDHPDDERPLGAPPDRMDRLWVHPAELSAVAPAPVAPARSRASSMLVPLAAGALGAIAAVVVLGLIGAFESGSSTRTDAPVEQQVAEGDAALSELARIVAPGLVIITVTDAAGTRQSTGVCVRHRGDVLTSGGTIGTATTAEITTSEGQTVVGTVVGRDDATGLVLVDAAEPLRAVPVSETLAQVGDSVWIFGATSPRETSPWISSGLVSSADAVVANAPGPMTGGLLETDALGTTWSAGGALVDRTGAVSGIVLWPQGDQHGAFAVPIDRAVEIADELRENGYVAHGAMPVDAIDTPNGPQLVTVAGDSAAGRAGMLAGDVIVSVDRRAVVDRVGLIALLHAHGPGSVVDIGLWRNGEKLDIEVTLGATMPVPSP